MKTAFCIASGPSLRKEDVDLCQNRGEVIVVNDCYKLAPWADVLYACDYDWWQAHDGAKGFEGEKMTWSAEANEKMGIPRVEFEYTGGNSGFQALLLAVKRGAKRVFLLGYDMKRGADGKSHWFGDHPGALNRGSNYKDWCDNFARWAPKLEEMGVEVINCSRDSALTCFPKMSLEDAILLMEFDKHVICQTREDNLGFALTHANCIGTALEFGVFKGKSLRMIDEYWRGALYGFDSWQGLPEGWDVGSPDRPHPEGTFKCEKPTGYTRRVKLIDGWFSDTIPNWKFDCDDDIAFLHIDSDLYSSAVCILSQLDSRIVPGTVICFDELLNFEGGWYKKWHEGEFKALTEWLKSYQREIRVISRSKFNQATVMVVK
jgi:hypothetical protein